MGIRKIATALVCIAWAVRGRRSHSSIRYASAARSPDNLRQVSSLLLSLDPSFGRHVPVGARPCHKFVVASRGTPKLQVRCSVPSMEDDLDLQMKALQAQLEALKVQEAQPAAPPQQLVEQTSPVAMPPISSVSDLGDAAQAVVANLAESAAQADDLDLQMKALQAQLEALKVQEAQPVAPPQQLVEQTSKALQAQLETLKVQEAQPVAPPQQLVEQTSQFAMPPIPSVSDLGDAAQGVVANLAESAAQADGFDINGVHIPDFVPVSFAFLLILGVGLLQFSLGDIIADEANMPPSKDIVRGLRRKRSTFIKSGK